jgi:hypothetical protein
MKSKGNNNKPILKVVTTKTLQPPKRYHSTDDVCLSAITRPLDSFAFDFIFNIRICHRRPRISPTDRRFLCQNLKIMRHHHFQLSALLPTTTSSLLLAL